MEKVNVEGNTYEIIKDYKNGYNKEEFEKKYTDYFENYDYIVVNDEVSNAADKIIAIIRAEHARTKRTIDKYQKMLEVK